MQKQVYEGSTTTDKEFLVPPPGARIGAFSTTVLRMSSAHRLSERTRRARTSESPKVWAM